MAQKFQTLESGKRKLKEAVAISTGVSDAGKIPALGSAGRFDLSMMPVGIAPDVKILEASEDISAGKYVNIYNDGAFKVRLADNSNGREAHGFVKDAITSGETATIYFEGANTALTGLNAGDCYLGTAGDVIQVPLNEQTETNKLHQFLGTAISATEANTDIGESIEL